MEWCDGYHLCQPLRGPLANLGNSWIFLKKFFQTFSGPIKYTSLKRIDSGYDYTHPRLADGKENDLYLPRDKRSKIGTAYMEIGYWF